MTDLGYVEWSEEYTPFGVALVGWREGPGWAFEHKTYAFHRSAALLRACRVASTSPAPVTVRQVAYEILPLRGEGVMRVAEGFSGHAVAVTRPGHGLIMGADHELVIETFEPDSWLCSAVARGPRTLQPGEMWTLPETFLLPFAGGCQSARPMHDAFVREWERCGRGKRNARLKCGPRETRHVRGNAVEHTVEITALAHGGDGIGRIEGKVCFVPYGLPGDTLRVRVTREAKNALWAAVEEVLSPSPHRIPAACPVFGRCGGCSWLHFAYPAQAEWKQRIVRDALERMAGINSAIEWLEEPALRLGYRTRAEFHGDGERLGFFAAGTHDVVDIEQCPLCHPRLNEALAALREIRIKGALTVTVNPEGEETLVWTHFPKRALKHRFPLANMPHEPVPRSRFVFDGVPIVNGTFSQSSLLLNRLLVRVAHDLIGEAVSVLDLYCGSGNLSLGLPNRTRVVGMDHNHEAVKAANGMKRGEYRRGGEETMAKLITDEEWDTILLDPPREGAKAIMPELAACHARAIVYVSCDPVTLGRDVKTLLTGGWKPARTIALDLFPNTPHVETVCRLER